MATGGIPVLSQEVITSEPYGSPPAATQRGSTSTLDSGDDRMQQAQFIKGQIWGELTTSLTIPGDRAVVEAWRTLGWDAVVLVALGVLTNVPN